MKKVIFVGLESLEIMKLNSVCDTEENNTINNCDSDNNHNSDNHSNTVVNNNDNNSNNGK
jgi:hypothetical protein